MAEKREKLPRFPEQTIVSPVGRVMWESLLETKVFEGDDTGKYQITLAFEPDDKEVNRIKKAIKYAIKAKFDSFQVPKTVLARLKKANLMWWDPLQDGDGVMDEEGNADEAFAGTLYVTAKTTQRPQVINAKTGRLHEDALVYRGCYARASLFFQYFKKGKNEGIHCMLNNVMFVRDGDPLGGASTAAQDFGDYIEGGGDVYDEDVDGEDIDLSDLE